MYVLAGGSASPIGVCGSGVAFLGVGDAVLGFGELSGVAVPGFAARLVASARVSGV